MRLDFVKPTYRKFVKGQQIRYEVYPEFLVRASSDLMTRGGGKFYAVYDQRTGFWTQDEYKIQEFIDEELKSFLENELVKKEGMNATEANTTVRYLMGFHSKSWLEYKTYVGSLPDHFHQLDDKLCFQNSKITKKDYVSRCLPYALEKGSYESWDKLIGTLYSPEEREKIEWAIGSVIAGDSKDIQKFVVLYGAPGAGKGTVLKIIQKLFPGYYKMFDAKTLCGSNAFPFEQFRTNPLIALQTDGNLSRIEDNTNLNSLISHETVMMNEKRKQSYDFTPKCFLFMASNNPVQITDSKSGIIRRLLDVNPTGVTIPMKEYDQLMNQIDFELGGIAWHCLEVYRKLGKNNYNGYNPADMMARTNAFYNFVFDKADVLCENTEGISLGDAYEIWNGYKIATGLKYDIPRYKFKEELKDYFVQFDEMKRIGNRVVRNWYSGGLKKEKFENGLKGQKRIPHNDKTLGLVLDQTVSLLDEMLADCQAQYAEVKPDGGSKPENSWIYCKTTLKDLDTKRIHFVRPPLNHIVIDFDLKNEKGEKDALMNLEAAEKFPRTYAEFSQGGKGVHLHYIYDGDPTELDSMYGPDIEIKVFKGKAPLRRRLSLCNNIPVVHINGGLPKKEVNETIDFESVKDEMHIRNIVAKCLRKDIAQPHTSTAMSLIKKTLDDAYAAGFSYDIRDMRPAIHAFAMKSSHQKQNCMKICEELKYCSKNHELTTQDFKPKPEVKVIKADVLPEEARKQATVEARPVPKALDETIVFFDCEVFPNLLLVNWKEAGEGKGIVRMINPSRAEIGELLHKKLVGFNCRRYDNHILYARYMGYDNEAIYRLSQRIVTGSRNAMFGNAYDLSYTDIYDFAATKQSLKKWEIELGIHHQELGLPWDEPVPEERWAEVAEYCDNDVIATEAVFNYLAGDFKARQILADIAGMKVNDTTNQLTTRIIFGDDMNPQSQFHYPDLAKEFPGYRFENGKSYYRHDISIPKSEDFFGHIEELQKVYGERLICMDPERRMVTVDEVIGEGGRVYAVQGIHEHVITFDVASMHPSSIIAENGFGKYTQLFKQLLDIRIAIKHRDFDAARKMLDGKLAKYLDDQDQADALSQALKIAINSVYGLTAAKFDNRFRDPRNKDNWVAKRGALFIETLRLKVMKMGGRVVHIKTDSIKVVEPSEEVKQFIMDYGKQWGYTFEVEDIYEKMCLVNDAVYIALRDREDPGWLKECRKAKKKAEKTGQPYVEPTRWSATGAQFAHPYIFKTLFSHEPLVFTDLCETKSVQDAALYLDFNERLSDVSEYQKDLDKLNKQLRDLIQKGIGLSMTVDEFKKALNSHDPMFAEIPADKEMLFVQAADQLKDREVLEEMIAQGHNYQFVGRAGSFCPVKAGTGGGVLCRGKDNKYSAATGSKGFRWREGEALVGADRMDLIDMGYFEALAETAKTAIGQYGDFEKFASVPDTTTVKNAVKMSIDEVLENSDKFYGRPPFDDDSIASSKEELAKLVPAG